MRPALIAVVTGLGLGSIFGLIAMGYTLIMAASGVFNFVQGTIVMGAALTFFGLWMLLHWPFLLVLAIVMVGGALLGAVTYILSVFPVASRQGVHELTEATLVTTFGLGLALNSVVALAFGYTTYPVNPYVNAAAWRISGVPIDPIFVVMLATAVFLTIVMELMLQRTKTGLFLRATVADAQGARLAGIRVMKVVLWSFAVAGALAAVAGLLMVPYTQASSNLAGSLALDGFAGMAIGGYGSFKGAMLGGLVVGLATKLPAVWVNPAWTTLIVYALMLTILFVRPRGLFGTAGAFGSARLRSV
jgi:branched-subunit amino acid ABC-type transport system permease component